MSERTARRLTLFTSMAVVLSGLVVNAPAALADGSVAEVANRSSTSNSATFVSLAGPTGTAARHVMLAYVAVTDPLTAITAPAGWTLELETTATWLKLGVYSRVAEGAEAGPHQWDFNRTTKVIAAIFTFRGVDNSDPVAAVGAPQVGSSTNTITAPAVTTTVAHSMLVAILIDDTRSAVGTASMPQGTMVTRLNDAKTNNPGIQLDIDSLLVTSTGVLGPATATAGTAGGTFGLLVALSPPTVAFAVGSSSGLESVTAVALTITMSGTTNFQSTVTVSPTGSVTLNGGSADLAVSGAIIAFDPGVLSRTLEFNVTGDADGEKDEVVTFTLTAVTNAELGTQVTHAYTILNDDPRIQVDADPFLPGGASATGKNWGDWQAQPGETNVAGANYVRIQNVGTVSPEMVTLDFDATSFAGPAGESIPIDGHLQFASCQTASSGTSPSAAGCDSAAWGSTSSDGAATFTFGATTPYLYVRYRLTDLPTLLGEGAYATTYTATAVG